MLSIPAIFSDHMVLQRQKKIHFWGSCDGNPASESFVTVCLEKEGGKKFTAKTELDSSLSWACALPPQKEGGPYTVSISLYCDGVKKESKNFTDVMIGEVWLAGGQSNMEYELGNDTDGKVLLENPPDLPIRYYYTPKISFLGKELEEAERTTQWQTNGSSGMKHWSAAAYFAVQKMSEELRGIAFGIIGCNWGGSYAVNWMDVETSTARSDTAVYYSEFVEKVKDQSDEEEERLTAEYRAYNEQWSAKADEYQKIKPGCSWKELLSYAGECRWPGPMTRKHEFRPGGLYESMIKRIAPYSLRGFLYYQGESDDKKPHLYFDLLSALIFFWRKIWKDEELFFHIFQLTVFYKDDDALLCSWAYIRRAQEAVFKQIRNTGLTVMTDWGEKTDIHPKAKKIPGQRAASQILHAVYGKPYADSYSPLIRSFDILEHAVKMHFYNADGGLYLGMSKSLMLKADTMCAEENPFCIWNDKGEKYPADVSVEKDENTGSYVLVLSSASADNPAGASYGWDNWFTTMMYNSTGLPCSPFNTSFM